MFEAVIGTSNEIVGGIVVAGLCGVLGWVYKRYKVLKEEFARTEQELERMKEETSRICATKEEHERLELELQRKDEELRQAETQSQEASRRIEALQQALEREKAKKRLPPISDADFLKLCESGDARQVEEAIMNGANVNAKNKLGRTALYYATYYSNTETASLLRKYGAR